MTNKNQDHYWKTLDRDLGRIASFEYATALSARPLVGIGIAFVFIIVAGLASTLFFGGTSTSYVVIAAAAIGAYMAVNIGANDLQDRNGEDGVADGIAVCFDEWANSDAEHGIQIFYNGEMLFEGRATCENQGG